MPQINSVIPSQNFEAVRNRIGEILADELANQYTLAGDDDLNVDVYIERSVPLAWNKMPAVNILLSRGPQDNQHQGAADGTYVFNIDCYASAKSTDDENGDALAATKVQKLVGVCRYILEHTAYRTLGFAPGFIGNKKVEEIQFQDPENTQDATSTAKGRIVFSVRVQETTTLLDADLIAGYDTVVKLGETEEGYRWSITNSLPAPFGLIGTLDPYGILLVWNYTAGVDELGFNIYRSVGYPAAEYELIGTSGPDVTMFIDDGAPTDEVIFYYVTAFNAIRESNSSNIVAMVISSGGNTPLNILNDKPTGAEVVLADATPLNNTLTAIVFFTNIDGTDYEGVFYVPAQGDPAHFHVEAADGTTAQIALASGIMDIENNIYGLKLANFSFRDLANAHPLSLKHRKIFTQTIRDANSNTLSVTAQAIGGANLDEITTTVSTTQPIGLPLMKTGQTDSFGVTGSDGDLQKGRLTNFTTLPGNNPFGNADRFTDLDGAQLYPEGIAIDWSQVDDYEQTVQAYRTLPVQSGSFLSCVAASLTYSLGGFDDWWMANRAELWALKNDNLTHGLNYAPFNYMITNATTSIYSNTQRPDDSTVAYGLNTGVAAYSGALTKTQGRSWWPTRRYTYAELGL